MTINEFSQLNLHPQLVQTVTDLGYTEPTPIQAGIIPLMLSGRDVIGQAQTGTGKTAAFSLPILNNLLPNDGYVQSLVLAPTRELAIQVSEAMYQYGKDLGVKVLAVYGGQPYSRQVSRLKKGVDVVIGTPGRLLDLIRQNALDLSQVSTVVLDEADEMLSMGFIDDIESILQETPDSRQTALLSATLPSAIRRLAARYMREPQACTIERKQLTVDTIEQRYYLVNESDKTAAMTRLLEMEAVNSAIVFTRTRQSTGEVANALTVRGYPAETLNGDLNQDARTRVLNRFRNGQIAILVATDVAARGLDIDDISHVFNYDLPQDPEVYVHRVGRTGRAGRDGTAISLLTPADQGMLRRIESYTKQKMSKTHLPTPEEILAHRESLLMGQVIKLLEHGRHQREWDLVAKLIEDGYDPFEVATATLKLARAEEKQRPIDPIREVREWRNGQSKGRRGERNGSNGRSRTNGNGRSRTTNRRDASMIRLSLDVGRRAGTQVNHVVGTLAHYADIPGEAIGKIRIQEQNTFVDVPKEFVAQVLAKTGRYRINRQPVQVEVA